LKDTPLYIQVKSKMIASLTGSEWRLGERIPTEPELASRYGVGISTVRAAVTELERLGVLSRKQGKGTYVVVPSRHTDLHRFFRITPTDGSKGLPDSKLISFRRAKADPVAISALNLHRTGSAPNVYVLENVLHMSGEPVAISEFTLPAKLFPKLTRARFVATGLAPFGFYQQRYGISIIRTVERIFAVPANKTCADHLDVRQGEPILQMMRVAYTFGDVPVEFRCSNVLTRNHCFLFEEGGAN